MSVYLRIGRPPQLTALQRAKYVMTPFLWGSQWLGVVAAIVMATELFIK